MKILLLLFSVIIQPKSDPDTLDIINYNDFYLVITNDNSYPAVIQMTTYKFNGTEIDAIDFVEAFGHAAACNEYNISHEYSFMSDHVVEVNGHEYDHNCGDYLPVGGYTDEELNEYYEQLHSHYDPYAFLPSITESFYTHYYEISNTGNFFQFENESVEEITVEITDLSMLDDFPKSQLKILRNCIFARHGYTFKSADLNEFFFQFDWYEPGSGYSDDLLTDTDREIIDYIRELESNK